MTETGIQDMDIEDGGTGPCLLCLPGSFSTAAAWRPLRPHLEERCRVVATSMLGYGGTAERRQPGDGAIGPHLEQIAGLAAHIREPVHLVGHSFGGLVALAAAMNATLPLKSLILIDAIPLDLLRHTGHQAEYDMVEDVARVYLRDHEAGGKDAARHVVDMWNGPGAYDALAEKPRAYIARTAQVNLRDWVVSNMFQPPLEAYRALNLPVLVMYGAAAHPAMEAMARELARNITRARLHPVDGASHFLLHSHTDTVAQAIDTFVADVEAANG